METADDTLARLEQQLEKARKAVLAGGGGADRRPERGRRRSGAAHPVRAAGTWTCTRSGSPIDFGGEGAWATDGCDAVRFLMSANAGEDLKPIAQDRLRR